MPHFLHFPVVSFSFLHFLVVSFGFLWLLLGFLEFLIVAVKKQHEKVLTPHGSWFPMGCGVFR